MVESSIDQFCRVLSDLLFQDTVHDLSVPFMHGNDSLSGLAALRLIAHCAADFGVKDRGQVGLGPLVQLNSMPRVIHRNGPLQRIFSRPHEDIRNVVSFRIVGQKASSCNGKPSVNALAAPATMPPSLG